MSEESKELERLHNHPARVKGILAVSESCALNYLEGLRDMVARRMPDKTVKVYGKGRYTLLRVIDEAISDVHAGIYNRVAMYAECALGHLHQQELERIERIRIRMKAIEDVMK